LGKRLRGKPRVRSAIGEQMNAIAEPAGSEARFSPVAGLRSRPEAQV
jgi:hypothetical protein